MGLTNSRSKGWWRYVAMTLFAAFQQSAFAGWTEYVLVDFRRCEVFTLTSDVPFDGFIPGVSVDGYQEWEAAQRSAKHLDESWSVWALIRHRDVELRNYSGQSEAVMCGVASVECVPVQTVAVQSFACDTPADDGRAVCKQGLRGDGNRLFIYGVDTTEYEEGGDSVRNLVLERDLARFAVDCGAHVTRRVE